MLSRLDLSQIPQSGKKSLQNSKSIELHKNKSHMLSPIKSKLNSNSNTSNIYRSIIPESAKSHKYNIQISNLNHSHNHSYNHNHNHNALDSSIRSYTTELLNLLNSNGNKKIEVVPFDDYSNIIFDKMAKYHSELGEIIHDSEEDDTNLTIGEEKIIRQIFRPHNHNHIINHNNLTNVSRSQINTISEESIMKVNITNREYKNPYQSFKVLKKNKRIYEDVTNNYLERQEQFYGNAIEDFNKATMKFNVKMPKIKITSLMPKLREIPKMKHKEEVSLDRDDDDEEKNFIPEFSSGKLEPILPNPFTDLNKNEKHPQLFSYYKYPCKNFPEGREQFAFNFDLSHIVMWGGITSNKNIDVWALNPESFEWTKNTAHNFYPPNPRFGHTGILYEKKFYIFGGKAKTNDYAYIPELEYYNLDDGLWTSPILNSTTVLKLRKNHIADLIGHQMIIHGGHTENMEFLNDTHLLGFHPLKWVHCIISEDTPGPFLSGHACALVLPGEIRYNNKFNIYKFPELGGIGRLHNNKIKEKGWYIFGGRNKEGGITNDLWILRLGKKPLEWIKPETSGLQPPPRYSHSVNFYEQGNYLIVHGGRNDLSSESFAINDTFVLNLNRLEWIEVKLYSDLTSFQVFNRCGHSAVVYTNKLIVFGGMNNNNYLGSSIFILHLDFNSRPILQTEDEKIVEIMSKNLQHLGSDGAKRLERLKKKALRRQLSTIDEILLPEIK